MTELDGVEVRLTSEIGERESSGEWLPFESLSVDELLGITDTLEPVQ